VYIYIYINIHIHIYTYIYIYIYAPAPPIIRGDHNGIADCTYRRDRRGR